MNNKLNKLISEITLEELKHIAPTVASSFNCLDDINRPEYQHLVKQIVTNVIVSSYFPDSETSLNSLLFQKQEYSRIRPLVLSTHSFFGFDFGEHPLLTKLKQKPSSEPSKSQHFTTDNDYYAFTLENALQHFSFDDWQEHNLFEALQPSNEWQLNTSTVAEPSYTLLWFNYLLFLTQNANKLVKQDYDTQIKQEYYEREIKALMPPEAVLFEDLGGFDQGCGLDSKLIEHQKIIARNQVKKIENMSFDSMVLDDLVADLFEDLGKRNNLFDDLELKDLAVIYKDYNLNEELPEIRITGTDQVYTPPKDLGEKLKAFRKSTLEDTVSLSVDLNDESLPQLETLSSDYRNTPGAELDKKLSEIRKDDIPNKRGPQPSKVIYEDAAISKDEISYKHYKHLIERYLFSKNLTDPVQLETLQYAYYLLSGEKEITEAYLGSEYDKYKNAVVRELRKEVSNYTVALKRVEDAYSLLKLSKANEKEINYIKSQLSYKLDITTLTSLKEFHAILTDKELELVDSKLSEFVQYKNAVRDLMYNETSVVTLFKVIQRLGISPTDYYYKLTKTDYSHSLGEIKPAQAVDRAVLINNVSHQIREHDLSTLKRIYRIISGSDKVLYSNTVTEFALYRNAIDEALNTVSSEKLAEITAILKTTEKPYTKLTTLECLDTCEVDLHTPWEGKLGELEKLGDSNARLIWELVESLQYLLNSPTRNYHYNDSGKPVKGKEHVDLGTYQRTSTEVTKALETLISKFSMKDLPLNPDYVESVAIIQELHREQDDLEAKIKTYESKLEEYKKLKDLFKHFLND